MSMSIQYAGFHVQPHGRDYSYYVLDPPAASRHFILTITHQAFAERRILYQDAADLCYRKLQREMLAETGEWPLGSHCIISDQELDAYRATHRPPTHRSWQCQSAAEAYTDSLPNQHKVVPSPRAA